MTDQTKFTLSLENRGMTTMELQKLTGYNLDYVRSLTRSGQLKSSKSNRKTIIDLNDALRHVGQTTRNAQTGKLRVQKKYWKKSNVIKMTNDRPGKSGEALAC